MYGIDFSMVYITRDSSQTKNSDNHLRKIAVIQYTYNFFPFCLSFFFRWSYGIVLHEIFTLGKWIFFRFLGDLGLFGLQFQTLSYFFFFGVKTVRWRRKPEENTISAQLSHFLSRRPENHPCADYRPLNWNFKCDRGGLLSNLQTESIIVIIRVWVVLERTMRAKVIIRGLCDGDSRMLISQPLSLTTILFRTTIIRTCRLHNQLLISNLSLYWKENLQVCYYSVLSFLQNLFLQLSGSWHLFFWVKYAVFFIFAGGNPYDGMSGQEVFTYVSHGHKLRRSSGVSRELYVESRSS